MGFDTNMNYNILTWNIMKICIGISKFAAHLRTFFKPEAHMAHLSEQL